jgi:hypothetical protein
MKAKQERNREFITLPVYIRAIQILELQNIPPLLLYKGASYDLQDI